MLLTQSLLEYGALDSLAESVIRLRARGYVSRRLNHLSPFKSTP